MKPAEVRLAHLLKLSESLQPLAGYRELLSPAGRDLFVFIVQTALERVADLRVLSAELPDDVYAVIQRLAEALREPHITLTEGLEHRLRALVTLEAEALLSRPGSDRSLL
ncbi:hypothetical protein CSUI_002821 [Cystoisospora suis]|uniref:Uncharacterized protein n=1 Tax=Cystoisospora suis TaxID=483139 RepID=A0A2C6KGZ9_9APIC|nr:hypothetical protein CSUI_002821 [Cystoisospora suis]